MTREINLLSALDLWTCSLKHLSTEKQGMVLAYLTSTDVLLLFVLGFFVFLFLCEVILLKTERTWHQDKITNLDFA